MMDLELESALDEFIRAIERGSPEEMCIAARYLRMCCIAARDAYTSAWSAEIADNIAAGFRAALDRTRQVFETDPDARQRYVAAFSYCRILARQRDLFREDAKPYERFAADIRWLVRPQDLHAALERVRHAAETAPDPVLRETARSKYSQIAANEVRFTQQSTPGV